MTNILIGIVSLSINHLFSFLTWLMLVFIYSLCGAALRILNIIHIWIIIILSFVLYLSMYIYTCYWTVSIIRSYWTNILAGYRILTLISTLSTLLLFTLLSKRNNLFLIIIFLRGYWYIFLSHKFLDSLMRFLRWHVFFISAFYWWRWLF